MKILIAIDGSASALKALRFVLRHRLGDELALISLIHVDAPLNGHIADHLDAPSIEHYHQRNAAVALRSARRALRETGWPYDEITRVGDAAEEIVAQSLRGRFDMIAMGSHGRGALATALMGSVVRKVLSRSKPPVLVVR